MWVHGQNGFIFNIQYFLGLRFGRTFNVLLYFYCSCKLSQPNISILWKAEFKMFTNLFSSINRIICSTGMPCNASGNILTTSSCINVNWSLEYLSVWPMFNIHLFLYCYYDYNNYLSFCQYQSIYSISATRRDSFLAIRALSLPSKIMMKILWFMSNSLHQYL